MRVTIQLKHILVLLDLKGPLTQYRIQSLLNLTPIKAEIASPQTIELINIALRLKIITVSSNNYIINFLIQNKNPAVLTQEEKSSLINLIIKNKELAQALKLYKGDEFEYNPLNLLHRLLFELDMIDKRGKSYYVKNGIVVQAEDIWKYKDNKELIEIGKFAEREIFNKEYEKIAKHKTLLEKLKHVSIENDALGYDIKSYDVDKNIEIFLEVKGTSGEDVEFFLTSNELDIAKELGYRYRIMVVCGINLQKQTYSKIIEIDNPAKTLERDYTIKPRLFRVNSKRV